MDRTFEHLCIQMQEAGIQNPKKLSKFEFEQVIDYFKEKNKNNPNT